MSAQAGRWWRRTLVLLIALGLVGGLVFGLEGLGGWLITSDPLAPARAVVVLGGHVPFRAMEAAAIYRQGWAPEVWLTRGSTEPEEAELRKLGIPVLTHEFYNRSVLERLGVPPTVVRMLDGEVHNTREEIGRVAGELQRVGGDRVIVVTSKPHTRRVKATWGAVAGNGSQAIVRYASGDPFEPRGWWQRTRDALTVSRELFGLLNVWAGFPVQPDKGAEHRGAYAPDGAVRSPSFRVRFGGLPAGRGRGARAQENGESLSAWTGAGR